LRASPGGSSSKNFAGLDECKNGCDGATRAIMHTMHFRESRNTASKTGQKKEWIALRAVACESNSNNKGVALRLNIKPRAFWRKVSAQKTGQSFRPFLKTIVRLI